MLTNNFAVVSKAIDDIAILQPKGYMNDLGAERLEHECEQFLGKGLKKLIINFSDIQHINSMGASILIGIVQRISESKGQLYFTNIKKVHFDVFEMLGIIKYVKIFKEEKEALKFLIKDAEKLGLEKTDL